MITFDFIIKCWKEKNFPDGFLDELDEWLTVKEASFGNVNLKDVARFVSQVAIAIEIGMALDAERFQWHYDYWKNLLGREWEADLEEVVVKWK